jgi:hypothetical protein
MERPHGHGFSSVRFQSRQKSLNRVGARSVYRTVCWIDRFWIDVASLDKRIHLPRVNLDFHHPPPELYCAVKSFNAEVLTTGGGSQGWL